MLLDVLRHSKCLLSRYGTLLVNVVTTVLGPFLDKLVMKNLEDQVENSEDR